MKVIRGIPSKPSFGRYFPLGPSDIAKALASPEIAGLAEEVTVDLRNAVGPFQHGHLLLELERGRSLTLFSLPDAVPAVAAAATARMALGDLFRLPRLEIPSRQPGRRQRYRAYMGALGQTVLTRVSRVYSVGRYRGNESLATASKPRIRRESEHLVSAKT
jgi:hypothetical protein